jgi:hypothetical protein
VSPGDVEFVQVVASMVVCPLAVGAIVLVDERRLRGPQLTRAWPPVSRDAAIFGAWQFGALYGCLLLVVHFTKTRWSLVGVLLGALWAAILLGVDIGSILLAGAVIDWLGL